MSQPTFAGRWNLDALEAAYQAWQRDPQAVEESWRLFFEGFVYPGTLPFCEAVMTAPSAGFYKQIALFAKAFFELEKASLDMD